MNLARLLKPLLACICIIIIVFVAVSLLDILIAVFFARFYTNAAFIITFGVGGVFAATLAYTGGMDFFSIKDEWARWFLIIMLIITGFIFFFPLAKLEGGEYEAAFKAYGATLALGSLLFVKGTVD